MKQSDFVAELELEKKKAVKARNELNAKIKMLTRLLKKGTGK